MSTIRATLFSRRERHDADPAAGTAPRLSLAPDDAHVWRFAYETCPSTTLARIARWMPEEDRKKAERFVLPEHRDRCLLRRAFMRGVLSLYTGEPAADVQLTSDRRGKPRPLGASLSLSVSHTDDVVLLAVAPFDVGVDVERVANDIDVRALLGRVASEDEAVALDRAAASRPSGDDEKRAFLRVWCRKEACLKVTGIGLLDDLTLLSVLSDTVDLGACSDARVRPQDRCIVHVSDLDIGPSHVAALAGTKPCAIGASAGASWDLPLPHDGA
jgi:4'-phosphopantetheinyl transferase